MEKRLMTFIACLFLSIGMALAQTQVSGTVTSSEDGSPVIGASIKVVGTNTGTVTNIDGNFSLNVSANAKLEVSYIGMVTKTVKAAKNMKIVLDTDSKSLDEVMVVAYGTEKKSAFTGSAAVVGAEEIGKVQVTNVVDALKGKAAGVQMIKASGAPGSTSTIRIRGISSINAGNDPLIVVDGSPYDGDINTINPSDIESMTVLKDASSSALYGARGANGVIIITTKSGKIGEGNITVDAKWGSNSRAIPDYEFVTSPAKYYEMWYAGLKSYAMADAKGKDKGTAMTNGLGYSETAAHEWANSQVAAAGNYGLGYQVFSVPEGQQFIGTNGRVNPNATLGNVVNGYYLIPDDWTDAIFSNSLRQEYTVTANGANDRGSFYTSVNYLSFDGLTPSSDYERLAARFKADYKIKNWLKVGANISYTHYDMNGTNDEGEAASTGNVFAFTSMAPIYPLYNRDANGNIIFDNNSGIKSYDYGDGKVNGQKRPYMAQSNPLSDNQLNVLNTNGNTLNATGTVEISLPYDFKVTSINSVYNDEYRATQTTNPYYGQYASSNGVVYKSHGRSTSYNLEQRLNWVHSYGNNNISAQLGHTYYDYRVYSLSASRKNQFSPDNTELNGAVASNGTPSSSMTRYNTESYMARALYNWSEKYFGQVSYVRQASSRFAKSNRWGSFWSLGGAWLISKENWFKAKWIDELRLKASYGQVGNDNIGEYLYTQRYSIKSSSDNASLIPSSVLKNEDISWETGGMFNAGVEFSMFGRRLNGNVEFFSRKTSDMLFAFSLPTSYGYTSQWRNIGDMMNNGIEVSLDGDVIRTKDLVWSLNVNFSYDHNYVSKLPDANKTLVKDGHAGYSNGSYFVGEDLPLNTLYLHKYAGVDPETGIAMYWKDKTVTDENGKETTEMVKVMDPSEASFYLCGSTRPEVFGGFGTSVSYKGFDFSAQFSYQLGGQILDSNYQQAMSYNRGQAFHVDLLNAWTPENKNTDVPRLNFMDAKSGYEAATSDRFLISASCLSLDNIQLGYTFPKTWMQKLGLQSLRVYATADNVWVWSKRQGLDPRQSLSGGANSTYAPSIRTISGGLTVTF